MVGPANKQENVTIKVSGMSCQHCVQSIENALQQSNGVDKVLVDLNEEKAYIEYDPYKINEEKLLQAIKDAGYEGTISG